MSRLQDLLKKVRGKPPVEREPPGVEITSAESGQLATVFSPPRWLRDLGRAAWLLVGVFLLLAGVTWLLGATYTIGGPVIAATIVATVTGPVVARLSQHMPRAAGAAIVLLGIVAIAVFVFAIVVGGITSQRSSISAEASSAADRVEGWLNDAGVDESGSASAKSSAKADIPKALSTLVKGAINGIKGIASVAFGLSLAMLSLFFLLKDGPPIRRWVDRHLGVPLPVARTITGGIIRSLRGYFRGVTIVAAFNGVVVGLAALVFDVPLAGTIGVVTFVTAYVPYLGAFVGGAFAVIIALGAKGTTTAIIMLVVVILANGLLQNLFQPFAMGAALDLHPLAVLVITIAAGCVFGMIGLVLAAPLASAAVHITHDLAKARAEAAAAELPAATVEGPAETPPDAPPATA